MRTQRNHWQGDKTPPNIACISPLRVQQTPLKGWWKPIHFTEPPNCKLNVWVNVKMKCKNVIKRNKKKAFIYIYRYINTHTNIYTSVKK
jgi:hypothetical protein